MKHQLMHWMVWGELGRAGGHELWGQNLWVRHDFRIGALKPGETKFIKGKIYILPNEVPALLTRYAKDFPTQPKK